MQTACTQIKFIAFCCSLLAFHPKGLESFAEINGDSCSTKGKVKLLDVSLYTNQHM